VSGQRRLLAYVVIALIVGAALALAVALAQGNGASSRAAAASAALADSSGALYSSDGAAGTSGATDPAKQEPLLDKFTSKDPFAPFGTTSTSGGGGGGGGGGGSTTLSAKVKVNGTSYTVTKGDEVPGGSAAAFTISSVTASDVTFAVIDGTLKNGDSSITVNLGESVKATLESGKSYDLAVVSIGGSSGGGGGGGGGSHSIAVVSVSSQNGTAMATFEVDGKTYADKQVGDVFSTSWGEIKVVAIDTGAQTVTIMHGDQTLTLKAGQVVVK